MFYLCERVRGASASRVGGAVARAASAVAVVCLLASAAAAYTVVMRGGHRVEIPDDFRVSQTALTYESAPGLNVTLQLSFIDIEATERANGEPAGSFFRRAAINEERARAEARRAAEQERARRATRTLTNRDLERSRAARVAGEQAYERRRKELGLPSAEEMRERDERETEFMRELALRTAEAEADAESYWRARSGDLRAQTGALDAEIGYLRRALDEMYSTSSGYFSTGAIGVFTTGSPFFGGRSTFGVGRSPFGPSFRRAPFGLLHPSNFFGGRAGGRRFGVRARVNVSGGTRGRVGVGFGRGRGGSGRGRHAHGFTQFTPGVAGFVAPFDYATADAEALATRLQLLEAEREGLAELWWQLEEEARRAGVPPGWLRP
jgi:hypothetical protein